MRNEECGIKETMIKEKKVGRNKSGRFTKGNTYAVGNKKTHYKAEYTKQMLEYFTTPATRVEYVKHYDAKGNLIREDPVVLGADYPTFEGFANKIGVTARTLENWAGKHENTFGKAYEMCKDIQKNLILVNALGGRYNGNFARFIASAQFDMAEKLKQEVSGIEGIDLSIEVLASVGGDKKN